MPCITYDPKVFRRAKLEMLSQADGIIRTYAAAGYTLTLRQLYYQFVARDLIPNSDRSYKMLGSAINDGRMAGYIDWDAIEDRTRNLVENSHWADEAAVLQSAVDSFAIDKWRDAPTRVEVWVEKEALAGVVERPAERLDVAHFCCRGYVSQSEQWRAGRRLRRYIRTGQDVVILHLGDHDPSGIDMTRDIEARLTMFSEARPGQLKIERIALNMPQIEELNPPPNPAKTTDSRFESYLQRFGSESWELDALPPEYLDDLIERHVLQYRDEDTWDEATAIEDAGRERLEDFIVQLQSE